MARSSVSASSRAVVDHLVLEQAVVEQREPGVAVGAVDEPARHERGQAELVRAALGGEPAVHDRERALGVGAVDRRGEREVGAQAVVAHAVVELDVHAEEALAGAQLERGDARSTATRVVAAPGARPLVADRARPATGSVAVTTSRARTGPDSVDGDASPTRAGRRRCRSSGGE